MSSLMLDRLAVRLGDTPVLADISLHVEPGEFVAILGPSGAGKSTLFGCLTGEVRPDYGRILYKDIPVPPDSTLFAFMPQSDALLPWRRVIDNVTLGLEIQGVPKRQAREQVAPYFADFGLAGFERHFPAQLSGGMRQRAAFLRTVIQDRPIQLLDEPFGALDALTRVQMQHWLEAKRQRTAWTTLLITHDVREAVALADRVYLFSERPARVIEEITIDLPRPRLTQGLNDQARRLEEVLLSKILKPEGETL